MVSKLVSKLVSQLVSKLVSKLLVVSLSSEIRKGRSYRGKSRPVFPLEIIEQVTLCIELGSFRNLPFYSSNRSFLGLVKKDTHHH